MMLKNRLTALVAVAAIAVPAVVFAAGKFSKVSGKGSVIKITGHAPAVQFDAIASDNAITVDDDGTTIKVSINGHLLKTGSDLRDTHMKEQVFAKGKTVVLSVTHADLDAGLPKGKVKGTLKFSDKPSASIVINEAKVSGGVVTGKFSTTRDALQIPEACVPKVKFPCTTQPLEVDATIYVSQ
jgi:hypothetical protein